MHVNWGRIVDMAQKIIELEIQTLVSWDMQKEETCVLKVLKLVVKIQLSTKTYQVGVIKSFH